MASQTEDRILEAFKKVGAHVDSAVGAFTNLSHLGRAGMQTEVRFAFTHYGAHYGTLQSRSHSQGGRATTCPNSTSASYTMIAQHGLCHFND